MYKAYIVVVALSFHAVTWASDECKIVRDVNSEKPLSYEVSNTSENSLKVTVESCLEKIDGTKTRQETSQYEVKAHSIAMIPAYSASNSLKGEIALLASKVTLGDKVLEPQSEIVGTSRPMVRKGDFLIGMNCHLSRYSADDQWHLLQMMRDAGVTTVRLDCDFRVRDSDNKFHFDPKVDETLLAVEAFGMRPLMVLAYFPPSFDRSSDKARMAYDWAKAIGEHYKGRVFDWEYGNETNSGWGGFGAAADMAVHNQAMALGSLAADSRNVPATFGIAEALPNYLKELFQCGLGPYMGAICLHPYCGISESGIAKLLANREFIRSTGGHQEIWATEIGFNYDSGSALSPTTKQLTQVNGYTLEQQADQLARLFILGKATHIDRIYWYDFFGKNDPETFWMVDEKFQPRPAYQTLRFVADQLKDAEPLGGTEVTELVQKHLFRRTNGTTFLAVWALHPNVMCDLHLPMGKYTAVDSNGKRLDINILSPVQLGETPIFIQDLSNATPYLAKDILVNALDERTWSQPMHRWSADTGQTVSVPCTAYNSTPHSVTLTPCVMKTYPGWNITVPPTFQINSSETVTHNFTVGIPKDAVAGVEYRLLFAAEMAGPHRTVPYEARIWVNGNFPYERYLNEGNDSPDYSTRRIVDEANIGFGRSQITAKKSSVTIDGNLLDWSPDEFVLLDQVGAWILRDSGRPAREDWMAKAAIRWDDTFLYVAFIVLDNDISCPDFVSRDWRDTDNVRILLSTEEPDKRKSTLTSKDYLIIYSPTQQAGDEAPAVMCASIGGYFHQGLSNHIQVSSRVWGGGYLVESAIPFSELKIQPKAGMTIGCNLMGDDSDNGFRRFTGMTTYKSSDYWDNPQTLGVLSLLP